MPPGARRARFDVFLSLRSQRIALAVAGIFPSPRRYRQPELNHDALEILPEKTLRRRGSQNVGWVKSRHEPDPPPLLPPAAELRDPHVHSAQCLLRRLPECDD